MNSEAYHSNCCLYALRQSNVVFEGIISTIKTHISNNYIKIKDIVFLEKKVVIYFILFKAEDCPCRLGKIKLEKLGHKKNDYIVGSKSYEKTVDLLLIEKHWMLYGKISCTTTRNTARINF